jgi:hypothetical protein
MGYSSANEVEPDDLTNNDEILSDDDLDGQILDDDNSIEETQSLVDEFEEILRS